MFHTMKIGQLFFDIPGDGGGGAGDEPAYELPEGVGTGTGDRPLDGSSARPTSASHDPASGGENGEGGDGNPSGLTPGSDSAASASGGASSLPPGRLEQMVRAAMARAAAAETQNRELQAQTAVLTRLREALAPQQAKADPRTEAVRSRLLEVIPELREVLELGKNASQIRQAIEAIPQIRAQQDSHWETHAERTMSTVFQAVAPVILGDEGQATALSEDQRHELVRSFRDYLLRDQTGQRIQRYERSDPKVVDEFRDYYTAIHAPGRRAAFVQAADRAAAGRSAPRAGRADAMAASVPKVDASNPDAVAAAAWKYVSNAMRASGGR